MKKQVTVEIDVTLADVLEDKTMQEIVNEISNYEEWIADCDFTIALLLSILDDLNFTDLYVIGQSESQEEDVQELKAKMKTAIKQMETGEV